MTIKGSIIFIVCLFVHCHLNQAQDGNISIEGRLLDAKSEEGIEYANIGIQGTPVGCISRQNGQFDLQIPDQEYWDSSILFSALGYEEKSIYINSLAKDASNIISLDPVSYEIEEAIISTTKPKLKNYGSKRGGDGLIKGMLHGLEKAYLVPVKKGEISLSVLRFCLRSEFDSTLFRVNFYETEQGAPGPRINNMNYIYSKISNENGWIECDLSELDYRFDSNFYIAVELLPKSNVSTEAKSKFKAKVGGKGKLFTRNYLDSWQEINGLGVVMNVDYFQYVK